MNFATIKIIENADTILVEVEYDPLPIKGTPNAAANVAAQLMLFLESQVKDPENNVLHKQIYDAGTGETFTKTKDKPSKQASDYQSTV